MVSSLSSFLAPFIDKHLQFAERYETTELDTSHDVHRQCARRLQIDELFPYFATDKARLGSAKIAFANCPAGHFKHPVEALLGSQPDGFVQMNLRLKIAQR